MERLWVAGRAALDRHGAEVGAHMDDGKILSGPPEAWPVAAADIAGGRLFRRLEHRSAHSYPCKDRPAIDQAGDVRPPTVLVTLR